jgi:galactose mutarotase-like enzyme
MNWLFNRVEGARISDSLSICGGKVLILENDRLRVVCLPAKGADIVAFDDKTRNCQCLMPPLREFNSLDLAPNPSGINCIWPEMFPVASAYGLYNGTTQPFHGEAHTLPWRYDILKDTPQEVSVRFSVRMHLTPFELVRTLTLRANEPVLHIDETVTNFSGLTLPLNWGHHPTFGEPLLSEHCQIYLPKGKFLDGDASLLKIKPRNANTSAMFYLTDFTQGWYGLYNHQKNLGFGMRWDPELFKVIWLWQSFNHHKNSPMNGREYAIAIEPVMSLPQTAAEPKGPKLYEIGPNGTLSTHLEAFLFDSPNDLPAERQS